MIDHDDMAIRGQMMTEYSENEVKIATRREALSAIGKRMAHVGEILQSERFDRLVVDANQFITPAQSDFSHDGKIIPRETFDIAAMAELLEEVRKLKARQSELRPTLQQIGFLPNRRS